MTPSRAKEVLEGMRLIRFDDKRLYGKHISADRNFVSLDYILDADQLQAIALWMTDPEGVTNAD
jgi:hypothetical protein